jgi:hypothetical protein
MNRKKIALITGVLITTMFVANSFFNLFFPQVDNVSIQRTERALVTEKVLAVDEVNIRRAGQPKVNPFIVEPLRIIESVHANIDNGVISQETVRYETALDANAAQEFIMNKIRERGFTEPSVATIKDLYYLGEGIARDRFLISSQKSEHERITVVIAVGENTEIMVTYYKINEDR